MANYIVPKNVKSRFEFVTGFGWRELFIMLAGVCIGLIAGGFVFVLMQSVFSIGLIGLGGGIGFFIGRTDPRTGKNALDLLRDFRHYQSKPRRYLYIFGSGRR
ncbi:PrgI family protein [Paenibacillus humicola]|uniref:PrgI family protein n=1 Tax=Paenibacillus humicola TaxID=3110540 RepID=UPI00237BEB81|nr:PrgI family protein [Paenibacillus humicola]